MTIFRGCASLGGLVVCVFADIETRCAVSCPSCLLLAICARILMSWQETEKRCRGRLKSCSREEFDLTFDLWIDGSDTRGGILCCFSGFENPGGGG